MTVNEWRNEWVNDKVEWMNGSTGNCTKEWTNVWMIDCANDNFMDDWLKNSHSLDVIWQDMSKRSGLPTFLCFMRV